MNKKEKKKLLIAVFCGLGIDSSFVTQYTASCLEYQSVLTGCIYEGNEWSLYFPWQFWLWIIDFYDDAPNLFSLNLNIFLFVVLLIGGGIYMIQSKFEKALDSHGSARWATDEEIKEIGLLNSAGVFLGKLPNGHYLRDSGRQHYILIAPTGSGKGVGLVLPICYSWKHSLVTIDIKGENWEKSSGYRKNYLNNIVLNFAPTKIHGSAKFNPFDEIRIHTLHDAQDTTNIAGLLINPNSDQKVEGDHWAEAAKSLLICIILHLKYTNDSISIKDILAFKANPNKPIREAIAEIVLSAKLENDSSMNDESWENTLLELGLNPDNMTKEEFKPIVHDWHGKKLREGQFHFDELYHSQSRLHLTVVQKAQEMIVKHPKEFASVVSTLDTKLGVYEDIIIQRNMEYSDFHIDDIMNHDKPVSLYLNVPPPDLIRIAPIFKLMIEMINSRLMPEIQYQDGIEKQRYKHRLLFLLDEFPALGKLESFEKALAFMRGYGIQAFLVVQGINQLNKIYTNNNSIIDNCKIKIMHTPNDKETPKWVSEMLGKKTITVKSKSYDMKSFFSNSYSIQSIGRDLLTPDEVAKFDDQSQIIFVAGHPPIKCKKIKYYRDENFIYRQMAAPEVSDSIHFAEDIKSDINPLQQ